MAKKNNPQWFSQSLITKFLTTMRSFGTLKASTATNYKTYLNTFSKISGSDVEFSKWIEEALEQKETEDRIRTIQYRSQSYASLHNTLGSNEVSAVRKFAFYILSTFDAGINMSLVADDFELAKLVAKAAIFATPATVQQIKDGKLGAKTKGVNEYASWDNCKSKRDNAGRRQHNNKSYRDEQEILHDNNTTANYAIKKAVLYGMEFPLSKTSRFNGYEACHIWGKADDERYYTSIMNLVLLPRDLAALSDHNDDVMAVLKYRSYKLFGKIPGLPEPQQPKNYSAIVWR